jgi:hypothetical protein
MYDFLVDYCAASEAARLLLLWQGAACITTRGIDSGDRVAICLWALTCVVVSCASSR